MSEKEKYIIFLGDQSQFEENDILNKYQMRLNKSHKFVVCLQDDCGSILTKNWKGHLTNVHETCTHVTKEDSSSINDIILANQSYQVSKETEPVQGLPTFVDGFKCNHDDCYILSESLKGIQKHISSCHPKKQGYSNSCFQKWPNNKRVAVIIF